MSAPKSAATKRAQASASAVAEFKARKKGSPIELPSGLVVVARRIELRSFLEKGDVPNPLMEVVQEALDKGGAADPAAMMGVEDGKVDLDMVRDMYEMVNSVVIETVVEPKVHPVPTEADVEAWNEEHEGEEVDLPEELRDDDLLYVDEVEDEDKMFIFQWTIGGTSDIASFRQEAATSLASVAQGKSPRNTAKRATRTTSR